MTLWQAILLGIVQGLTEYLPISSTAHLRIVPALLGWENPSLAFKAIIQLGTLAAVFVYFRADIARILRGVWRGESQLGWMIAVGTIPVVVLGLLFQRRIEWMNESVAVMALALIGLALVLIVAEWLESHRPRLREMSAVGWRDAIVVGCAQAVALIPGASRSGCTIAGGLFCGLTREAAARFSFLLSLPAIFAAGVFELRELRHATADECWHLITGTVVSFVVGYASIAFLLGYLRRHTMWLFIVYRLVLGTVLFAALASGWLPPQ